MPVTALFIRALHADKTCVLIWSAEKAAKRSHPEQNILLFLFGSGVYCSKFYYSKTII